MIKIIKKTSNQNDKENKVKNCKYTKKIIKNDKKLKTINIKINTNTVPTP